MKLFFAFMACVNAVSFCLFVLGWWATGATGWPVAALVALGNVFCAAFAAKRRDAV